MLKILTEFQVFAFFVNRSFPETIMTGMEMTGMLLEVKLHMSYRLYFSKVQIFKKIKHLIYGSRP